MIEPFTKNYALTQGWGVNEPSYRRFGLKGHNGTDWALPTGTEVLAPHDGKVLEVADEGGDGYGKYIKIESATEGSLVAHLKTQNVKVGQEVKQGQSLGLSNNTGNSTGPHLHWGYYRIPRNRADGFGGYIDPFPYIKAASPKQTVTVEAEVFEMLVTKATERDDVLIPRVKELEKELGEVKTQRDESDKAIITLNSKIEDLTSAIAKDAVNDKDLLIHSKELEEKVEELKKENGAPVEPVIDYYEPVLEEFFKNLTRGKKAKSFIDRLFHWLR